MFNRRGFLKGIMAVAAVAGMTVSGTTYSMSAMDAAIGGRRRVEAVRLANIAYAAKRDGASQEITEKYVLNMLDYINNYFPPPKKNDAKSLTDMFSNNAKWSRTFCINKRKIINTSDTEIAVGLVRYELHNMNMDFNTNSPQFDKFIERYADTIAG